MIEITENPYNESKGQSVIDKASKDKFGNVVGNEYDLVKDEAFRGLQIAVLHFYTGENFDFKLPAQALAEKGFKIQRWTDIPPVEEFKFQLDQSCQLWIISDQIQRLSLEYLDIITSFFNAGHGLYIWGDNEPYFQDANFISNKLFNVNMTGNIHGGQTVSIQSNPGKQGFIGNHPITTGLEFLYEGITIATIQNNNKLLPLIIGSADNLVASIYDNDSKRAIIDGGFTRLFVNWDTAGTGRYVKNAAAWLVNYEKFNNKVNNAHLWDRFNDNKKAIKEINPWGKFSK